MRNILMIGGAATALAACGQSTPGAAPTVAATSTGPTAEQATRLMGEWEYATEMKITDISGVSAATASQMSGTRPSQIHRECLNKPETRADVDKMFESGSNGCKFTKTDAPVNKIVGAVACNNPTGMNGNGTLNGTIGPSDLKVTMALKTTMPAPTNRREMATVQMLITMTGRRLGDCPK
jgi:hypothetical protein